MNIAHRFALITFLAPLALMAGCAATHRSAATMPISGLLTESLRCEYLTNPIGIDEPRPRLSWTLASDARGARQSAYQIIVASTPAMLEAGKADLWDSGKVASSEQNQIEYAGKTLASRQACVWRVRTWDGNDQAGPWSTAATWETGLTKPSDWQAKWIAEPPAAAEETLKIISATYEAVNHKGSRDVTDLVAKRIKDGKLNVGVHNDQLGGDAAPNELKQLVVRYSIGNRPEIETFTRENATLRIPEASVPVLRRAFRVDRPVVKARLYATALGLYELRLNGQSVSDHSIAPDWTDYRKRVRYQAVDVTSLIKSGANAIGGSIANGWYSGQIGNGAFQFYGKQPAMLAQLELTHDDGSIERISTDESWQSHAGPILSADLMGGEDYDARLAFDPSAPDLAADNAWSPVKVRTEGLPPVIEAQVMEPVRELITLPAKTLKQPLPGHWLFDMGQNMVGVPRLTLNAPAGTRVTIKFAEMLDPDGTIYTTNYRGAKSTDTYICSGNGPETWQPRFTFHGYRYVELTGLPTPPSIDAVQGIVLGSDTKSVGSFETSDSRINQLWSNIRWGQRGNFLSVPTDCPQRDERLGWTGDAQVFIGTAVYNADVAAFFTKWLIDVDDAQRREGPYTNTVPNPSMDRAGAPGWSDAGVICPWTIYSTYGDKRLLARHLPGMMKWVDWSREHSTGLIRDHDRGDDFGDWLSIGANTSKELLGTAYFAHCADLVSRSAKALGDEANAAKYAALFEDIKTAYRKKYFAADGSMIDGTQTTYAITLAFDLLPETNRPAAAQRLADDVKAKGDHLSTGFLGVSYLLPALANHGHADIAYRLLFQDSFPSWLFSIKHGATTIWERWDGWTPEKGFQDAGMNSFNHYSLGSCGQWMYSSVAGIAQAQGETGFGRLAVKPLVGGGLTHVVASYDSVRGKIATAWHVKDGQLTLDVTLPANVVATITVPTADPATVMESGGPAGKAPSVKAAGTSSGAASFEVGSGSYRFTAKAP